jgi:hypothetical protein
MRCHAAIDEMEIVGGIEEFETRTEQAIEEQIALIFGRRVAAQDENGLHPEAARRRSDHAGMVRLMSAGRDQHACLLRQRIGHQIFELAHLVAAAAKAGIVVALHAQGDADLLGKPRKRIDRSWKESELDAGKII